MDVHCGTRFDADGADRDAIRRMDGPVADRLARPHRHAVRRHRNRAAALHTLPDCQRLIAQIGAAATVA